MYIEYSVCNAYVLSINFLTSTLTAVGYIGCQCPYNNTKLKMKYTDELLKEYIYIKGGEWKSLFFLKADLCFFMLQNVLVCLYFL